jgi:hypothetical protein
MPQFCFLLISNVTISMAGKVTMFIIKWVLVLGNIIIRWALVLGDIIIRWALVLGNIILGRYGISATVLGRYRNAAATDGNPPTDVSSNERHRSRDKEGLGIRMGIGAIRECTGDCGGIVE